MQLLQQMGSEDVTAATQAVQAWLQKVAHPAAAAAAAADGAMGTSVQCCSMWGSASIMWVSQQQQQQQQQQSGAGGSAGSSSVREVWMPLARSEVEGTPVGSSSSRCIHLASFCVITVALRQLGLLTVQRRNGVSHLFFGLDSLVVHRNHNISWL
jgi:hypothetical protein